MRLYLIWILTICLLQTYGNSALAKQSASSAKQFVSLKNLLREQPVGSELEIELQEQTRFVSVLWGESLLYIDSAQETGWFNNRKLSENRDFIVSNGEVLISRNLLDELLQNRQPKIESTKKVYALYHGFRRTRLQDGDLGTWKIFYKTEASKTGIKYINYNPDLIDREGYHQVASSNGIPIVGMQSDSDSDNIEYKILLAKTALIDGFIVDYVFPEHSNTVLVKNFMKVAKKYNFEIGVDWLDASVYSNWVQNYPGYEDIQTRKQKTEYGKYALRYAWENFYSQPTAAKFNNRPLFFIFGGATPEELKEIIGSSPQINNTLNPIYIRRSQLWGKEVEKNVVWDDLKNYYPKWHNIGVDIFSWKATCVRPTIGVPEYSQWDKYASWNDNFDFAKQYAQMWQNNHKVNVNTACVWPGFDNKACAEWGQGTFSVIDRKGGTLYRSLWEYSLQQKSLLDIVFIASWSDFTEGHEIEPTVKNGYREVLSTLEFANQFKGSRYDYGSKPIYYPENLFRLRKKARLYQTIGLKTNDCQELLDLAAFAISRRYYQSAKELLQTVEMRLEDAQTRLSTKKIHLSLAKGDFTIVTPSSDAPTGNQLEGAFEIVLSPKVVALLSSNYYEGILNFAYFGDNYQKFQITSDTKKALPPKLGLTQGNYSVVADITKNNSNQWENCKVALFAENIKLAPNQSDRGHIRFSANAKIKDLSFDIEYYQVRQ